MSSLVDSLAAYEAQSRIVQPTLERIEEEQCRRRIGYDFKVTGFNGSMVSMIIALAIAIFAGSLLVCGLALSTCLALFFVRRAFLESIERTGEDRPSYRDLAERSDEIARHLGVVDPNWKPVRAQIVDFIVFLRWAPGRV